MTLVARGRGKGLGLKGQGPDGPEVSLAPELCHFSLGRKEDLYLPERRCSKINKVMQRQDSVLLCSLKGAARLFAALSSFSGSS